MLPLFTFPLAFAALAAVPALVAIYWLRNRFRPHAVSSLMLWVDQRQPREGGSRIQRLQIPLLLLLELLVLVLLIIAASDPRLLVGRSSRPLMVVLDDSYSMLAGEPDSARWRGLDAVRATLNRHAGYTTHLILAGPTPQTIGEPSQSVRRTVGLLKQWQCRAAYADLPKAIAFAGELGGPDAHILVITDHAPPTELQTGRTQWQAVGRPRNNLAITNAVRSAGDVGERCLIEIANLSPSPAIARLEITTGTDAAQRSAIQLGPNESQRITLDLPPGAEALHATLGDDDLAIDNRVVLLPEPRRPIGVMVRIGDAKLDEVVRSGLASTGRARLDGVRADLLITDNRQAAAPGDAWSLVLVRDAEASSFVGPFVIDRAHPLMAGLSLAGVVWGAGDAGDRSDQLPGVPVVTVGNTSLVTDYQRIGGGHELFVRLTPDLSTIQQSANWPILLWNLLDWRSEHLPGIRQPNVRLGAEASLTLAANAEQVQIIEPDGRSYPLPAHDRRVSLVPQAAGIHQIIAGGMTYRLAVNALSADESNLSTCTDQTWGDWLDEQTLQREYQSIAWLFILAALAAMVAHQWLIARAAASVAQPRGSQLPGAGAGGVRV